jgi:mannose-6-phosphate isomerase-like protein (cupin superfamily)
MLSGTSVGRLGRHVGYESVRYAMHESEAPDGRLFECPEFTQRVRLLSGECGDDGSDEVLYVLSGSGTATIDGREHSLRPGTALFVARGTPWTAGGDVRAVSVLVHHPEPAGATHALVDLTVAEEGRATAGRAFVLGAVPEVGCRSVTQFIGVIPPGRAPDHFHRYDEVIYVLEGEGVLEIGGEQAPIRAGACIHLPRELVHCLANTGEGELRVLGVFTPAGSPAEAYYPDGTLAALPERS